MDQPLPIQYQSIQNEQRLAALKKASKETGLTPNQLVLARMVNSTPSIIPLLGCSSEAQLEENLEGIGSILAQDIMRSLK